MKKQKQSHTVSSICDGVWLRENSSESWRNMVPFLGRWKRICVFGAALERIQPLVDVSDRWPVCSAGL